MACAFKLPQYQQLRHCGLLLHSNRNSRGGSSQRSCRRHCQPPGLNELRSETRWNFHSMSAHRGSTASPVGLSKHTNEPDHIVVLVHGIFASPSDWVYAEGQLRRQLGDRFLVYASSSNTYIKTFDGIDKAGRRLADEVRSVIRRTRSLRKISFLAHSLGGLFARYAIALLYSSKLADEDPSMIRSGLSNTRAASVVGTIAGLEAMNFITLATPHLGVRGKSQLPFLFGLSILEKLAPSLAPFIAGRTGFQLFLTDGKSNRPPLLLQMASDCDNCKFMSALGAFKNRIIYANVSYDHMVGWRTSSIRREKELPEPSRRSLDGYKHVVDVVYCPPVRSDGPNFPSQAAEAKEAAQNTLNPENVEEYHHMMEEEMIQGLQRISWKKVDVSFHSAPWPFFAHNNIHVKNEWFHNAGAGVIAHVADSIKQQESQHAYFAANL